LKVPESKGSLLCAAQFVVELVARPLGQDVVSILKRRLRALLKSNGVIAKHTLRANPTAPSALVIYDGECDFCRAALQWLQLKLDIKAESFHSAPLDKLGLTYEECAKQVVLLVGKEKFLGAASIAYLLRMRGNSLLAGVIATSGPIGRFGYSWVAAHRSSIVVRLWTRILQGKLSHES